MEWGLLPIQEESEEGFLWFQFTACFPVELCIQTQGLRDINSEAFILKDYTWHLDRYIYVSEFQGH